MPKSLTVLVWIALVVLTGPAGARQTDGYRWERISVVHATPSEVFARLGLTHFTRHGFTRDGFKKTDPDPTFPPGLTDIVPQDISHVLLVRGTPAGLAAFRARVAAADSGIAPALPSVPPSTSWQATVELLAAPGTGAPLGAAQTLNIVPEQPFVVTVGDPARPQTYRLRLHLRPGGALILTLQAGLLLPDAPRSPQVWTTAVSQPAQAGTPTLFSDLAAVKQFARQRLAWPQDPQPQDYTVRVTIAPPPSVTTPAAP